MPLELALLPVVESAFNPVAYSRSRASGLWQFIPSTGKHYGLQQNWWIDERRDVIRATTAALDYLQYLNRTSRATGTLPSPRTTAARARSAARCNATRRGAPDGFLQPRPEGRDARLRAEAAGHQPHRRRPDAYGLQFTAIPNQPYFDVVNPGRQINLGEAALLAGITTDDIFALNPAFNRMTTPPEGPHSLLLPVARVEPFRQALLTDDGSARVAAAAETPTPRQITAHASGAARR